MLCPVAIGGFLEVEVAFWRLRAHERSIMKLAVEHGQRLQGCGEGTASWHNRCMSA